MVLLIETSAKKSGSGAIPLKSWLWKSYLGAALFPLLVIELSFLGIYWGTSELVFEKGAGAVTSLATDALADSATREAATISARLQAVAGLTQVFADETRHALQTPAKIPPEAQERYARTPDGALYSTEDRGGSAVYFSGVVPIGPAELEQVWRTERLDPIMKSILGANPLVLQIYVNTKDSLNRIYPYFDVLKIYPPKMDIPSFNFYYEADPDHNPEGRVVWTDAYIDPAGSGWMVSAIAPVIGETGLEAVVGLDVTVGAIVKRVLNIDLGPDAYAMLLGRDGTLLALPPMAEADLGLTELIGHGYEHAILQDTFKPSEFNLFRRDDLGGLALAIQNDPTGVMEVDLARPMIASWSTVQGTDWHLITLASKASLLQETRSLRATLWQVNQYMLLALVVFYIGFFAVLWRRSSRMSEAVARPLAELEERMLRIANGETALPLQRSQVQEVQRANDHLMAMAAQLDAVRHSKATFLSAMGHELRTPLQAISGHSQLLRLGAGKPLDTKAMTHVDGIAKAGAELLALVEQVMDLSAIEQGKLHARMAMVPLGPILTAAIDSLQAEAHQRGVTICVTAADRAPPVWTDRALMLRILTQLLGNAVRYNRAQGQVSVTIAQDDGGPVNLTISDTGHGLPKDHETAAFEPFDRRGRENGAISGLGLGLTICQKLAAILGCGLSILSEQERGVTVTLRIPSQSGAAV